MKTLIAKPNRQSLPRPKGLIRFELRGDELYAQGKSLGKVVYNGADGKDYDLTAEDRGAIAKLAAELIPAPKPGKPYRPTKALKKAIADMIPVPKDGDNYALTDDDRQEIADMVPTLEITDEMMRKIADLVEVEDGRAPEHEIRGTDLRFRNPDGSWGEWLKFRIIGGQASMSAGAFIVKNHAELNGIGPDDHHAQAHTIVSHSDTSATGAQLDTLTDASNADALHIHTDASVTVTHASTTGQGTDDHHAQAHTVASHSDTNATGAQLNTLTDGSETALHSHIGLVPPTEIDSTDSPYSVLVTDRIIVCDTDSGAIEVNLPAGISGTPCKIVNAGSSGNAVDVDPNGTEQVYNGGAGVAQSMSDGEVMDLHYTTKGWW